MEQVATAAVAFLLEFAALLDQRRQFGIFRVARLQRLDLVVELAEVVQQLVQLITALGDFVIVAHLLAQGVGVQALPAGFHAGLGGLFLEDGAQEPAAVGGSAHTGEDDRERHVQADGADQQQHHPLVFALAPGVVDDGQEGAHCWPPTPRCSPSSMMCRKASSRLAW
ncbi:MAG: hypothetical protein M5U25_14835 [Planctomycetota bacterium]|nr:hypothetical protein [Planctomycetota bacterium]